MRAVIVAAVLVAVLWTPVTVYAFATGSIGAGVQMVASQLVLVGSARILEVQRGR